MSWGNFFFWRGLSYRGLRAVGSLFFLELTIDTGGPNLAIIGGDTESEGQFATSTNYH